MAAAAASASASSSAKDGGASKDILVAEPTEAVKFFRKLMNDSVTADLEIEVAGGEKFLAHRAVLAARSDEIREELAGTVSEARASLSYPEDDSRCWAQMLRFAYTNEWDYDSANVVQLRRLAEERGFADFEEVVAAAISKVFLKSPARAMEVALGAGREGDDGMMEAAFAACYKNPRKAMGGAAFLELDPDMVFTFADDDRAVANEAILFRALMRWAEHRLEASRSSAKRDDARGAPKASARWEEWGASEHSPETPEPLPLTYTGAAIREELGDGLTAVRFPRMDGRLLAQEVLPTGVLTDEQMADVLAFAVTPADARPAVDEVAGFSTAKRDPVEKSLRIIMWGGGGASGKYGNSGAGGAGGYLRVRYSLRPGETLKFYVGEGGWADKGSSERTTQAWPNSGKGGYNWKSGSGGGASYFTSDKRGDEVVAGAGGGGGGSAGQSYSAGGGGGGGTRDGKVGSGGDACCSGNESNKDGKDGNGNGAKGDSGGSRRTGKHNHGAGGSSGSGGTSADGGDGGCSSHKHASVEETLPAKARDPIKCPVTGEAHGEGASSGDKKRGKHGCIIVIDTSTGVRTKFEFKKREPIELGFA